MTMITGKERDAETGLDYFGARYMASAQGRWTSPDRINITRARMLSPTSTLNKYAYAANNPLKFIDPDGNDVTVFYRRDAIYSGHVIVAAMNQKTGRVGVADFYTTAGPHRAMFAKPPGAALSTIQSPSELRDYASITIREVSASLRDRRYRYRVAWRHGKRPGRFERAVGAVAEA